MTVKTDVNFRITGPCLSLLLRDCECSLSDQMGFLVGEKSSVTIQTISDAEMEEEKIETTISINGTFPVGLPFVFCSSLGRVDETTLKEVLGSVEKEVVGWYSFRRNCNHSISLRETILHRELRRVLGHSAAQFFVFCIITTSATDRNATHSLRFTFFSQNHRRLQPVSVVETNLGEPEDNVYRKSTAVDDSFKCLQQVFQSVNGVNNSKMAMTMLHTEMNKHLNTLQSSVSKLQHQVHSHLKKSSSCSYSCAVVDQKSRGDEVMASTSSKITAADLSQEY
ncbi:BRISC complex subunit Abraxas 2-like [Homalodisca vitripennis]|nr:BRISC complex subunit Abraxas 2-like [Homalodisca vitripennis]